MVYVTSDIDNKKYLVRDIHDKQQSANMLARIRERMITFSEYLYKNKNNYGDNKKYIEQLNSRIYNSIIIESGDDVKYTSYSVNKGQQLVFCVRSRDLHSKNKIHSLNLIMYVVLHEMAHVACPENGHTPLFKQIFAFFTTVAIKQKIYVKINFQTKPTEYCGLVLKESII
jgi:predicted metal-dependent hydrolase